MKKIICLAIISLGGALTMSLVSCANDDNMSVDTKDYQIHPVASNDSIFTFKDASGNCLTVALNGTNASVSRTGSASEVINAKMVYTDKYSGYLEMSDNTLSSKKIPFLKSKNILSLEFKGTTDFNGNSVCLTHPVVCSRASNDAFIDAISSTKAINTMENVTKGIIKYGINTCFGGLANSICSPILDLIFPASTAVDYSKNFAEIESQLTTIDAHINQLATKIHKRDLTEDYRAHWTQMTSLENKVAQIKDLILNNPNDSVQFLKNFASTSIDGYTIDCYLPTMLDRYFMVFGGTNMFQDLDEYLVTSYPVLSQSTGDRDIYRARDLKVLTECVQLMNKYWQVSNSPGSSISLRDHYDAFLQNYCEKGQFDHHDDEIVCCVPDAYFAMEKKVYIKRFGEKEFIDGLFNPIRQGYSSPDSYDGKWSPSYVFSNCPIKEKKQELNDSCMKADEAKAIFAYYNGSGTVTRTFYDILINDFKCEGIDDQGYVMLLGDWHYCDIQRGWDANYYYIMTRVWDNRKNQYDGNFTQDIISGKHVNFKSHIWNSTAYYTHITNHFLTNGKKDYDAFMKYIWQAPANPEPYTPAN